MQREDFFETNLDLRKQPQEVFFYLFLIFHICIYSGNWGVEGAMCQILELLDQNLWRNNLSKLATFNSIFQLSHSALICLGLLGLFQITIERLKCLKAISGWMGWDWVGNLCGAVLKMAFWRVKVRLVPG